MIRLQVDLDTYNWHNFTDRYSRDYLDSFPVEQREQVRAVAIDMGDTFYAAIAQTIPEAIDKIVYDRFHVMQHVSKAFNKVRSQESAELARTGDSGDSFPKGLL